MAHILSRQHVLIEHSPNTIQWVGIVMQRVVYFLLDVLLVVLATRFILRLFGASAANDFVGTIYGLTYPVVVPFSGIFGPVESTGAAAFEISTLIAMMVFGVLAYALARFIGILTTTRS